MSQSANVNSIDAIKDFRASYCRFAEDTKNALGAVDMEVRRALEWLLHDRPMYWQMEIKRSKEALSEAQAELFRRKLQARPGSEVRDTEQKEKVRKAKHRLEAAEAKLEIVKKWTPVFQHAVTEYQARSRPTADMLEGDVKLALSLLDRMATALDAYIATAPPSVGANEPIASAASGAPATTSQAPESAARPGDVEAPKTEEAAAPPLEEAAVEAANQQPGG
jgi:hypothetical protein